MERRVFEEHRKGGYAEVWHIAYPAVLTMISQTLMSFTDAVMVGRLGAVEIAGVGLAGTLVWGLYSFFNGLVNGINTFVAQDYGAKRYHNIGPMAWQGVYLAVFSGILLFVLSSYSSHLFRLMGPDEAVQTVGSSYLKIRMRGGTFIVLWMCFSAFMRGLGDTRTPLKITVMANLINIVGDYTLIYGKLGFPKLGTDGAAIATIFANGVGAAAFFWVFLSARHSTDYSTRTGWRPRAQSMRRLARIGLPIGLQWFLDMGSFVVFSAMIGRIGTNELAANEAAIRLMSLSFMPVFGLSIAATTLVGQYIGSDEMHLAVRSGNSSLRIGFFYTLFIAFVFLIFAGRLVSIINSDPEVVRVGSGIIRVVAIFQVFDGFGIVSNGCLRGAGDTRWAMYIGVGYAWLLFVPLAYIAGFVLKGGAVGAWAGATVYIITLGLTFFFRFRSGKWQSIKI
ncbi:MAG: MATE family efflux transporter [Candidatus Eisenbacteria bacterium]